RPASSEAPYLIRPLERAVFTPGLGAESRLGAGQLRQIHKYDRLVPKAVGRRVEHSEALPQIKTYGLPFCIHHEEPAPDARTDLVLDQPQGELDLLGSQSNAGKFAIYREPGDFDRRKARISEVDAVLTH